MILSDRTIRRLIADGTLGLDPYTPAHVQPASVDVTLGSEFLLFFGDNRNAPIDPLNLPDRLMTRADVGSAGFYLPPGGFVLGTTIERLTLPADIVCRVEGKSSLARLGLLVHATAGFVDPGFEGQITLELANLLPVPIKLTPGMKIAQLSFMQMDRPAERPYGSPELGSRYQGQAGPVASRYGR